jgi:hypothetical protein
MTNNKQQTEMNKEFVPYEEALALKELGFDEPCLSSFDENKNLFKVWENDMVNGRTICLAPLYQQAFRFFRDNGKVAEIFSQLLPSNKYKWGFKIQGVEGVTDGFFTYEEAELRCLKHLIKTVKENENQI